MASLKSVPARGPVGGYEPSDRVALIERFRGAQMLLAANSRGRCLTEQEKAGYASHFAGVEHGLEDNNLEIYAHHCATCPDCSGGIEHLLVTTHKMGADVAERIVASRLVAIANLYLDRPIPV